MSASKHNTHHKTPANKEPIDVSDYRCYADPDAAFCYSASKDEFIFGTREMMLCPRINGYDLPLVCSIVPTHHGEGASSMRWLEHLLQRN